MERNPGKAPVVSTLVSCHASGLCSCSAPTFPGASGSTDAQRRLSTAGSISSSRAGSQAQTPSSIQNGYILSPASIGSRSPLAESSRASSVSSADSEAPTTPASASSFFSSFSGRAMTGFKRISSSVASSLPKAPQSARDSYFPPYSTHSEQQQQMSPQPQPQPHLQRSMSSTSWPSKPVTPNGLRTPNQGFTSVGFESSAAPSPLSPRSPDTAEMKTPTVLFDDNNPISPTRSSPVRGHRKPVPKAIDESVMQRMSDLRVEEETHAL